MATADLVSIKDASKWASEHIGKIVSTSNISYLVQYVRIRRFGENGTVFVSLNELHTFAGFPLLRYAAIGA